MNEEVKNFAEVITAETTKTLNYHIKLSCKPTKVE